MSRIVKLFLAMTIALTMGLFGMRAEAQDASEWRYNKNVDEFTEKVGHALYLAAKEKSPLGEDVTMIISCRNNVTSFTIATGTHILSSTYDINDSWEADYRIDDLEADKFKVLSLNDIFTPHVEAIHIPLIKSMFGRDKLRMRFETYKGSETVTFKITNLEDEIKPIREACNW